MFKQGHTSRPGFGADKRSASGQTLQKDRYDQFGSGQKGDKGVSARQSNETRRWERPVEGDQNSAADESVPLNARRRRYKTPSLLLS